MKRIPALLLVLLVLGLIPSVSADTGRLRGGRITAAQGETVRYTVFLDSNPGLAAFYVTLRIDGDAARFTGEAERGDFSAAGMMLTNTATDEEAVVSWFNTATETGSGTLFTIPLTVSEDAVPGEYPVTISLAAENTLDESGAEVPLQVENGSLTVLLSESSGPCLIWVVAICPGAAALLAGSFLFVRRRRQRPPDQPGSHKH